LDRYAGDGVARPVLTVVDRSQRLLGDHVEVRSLHEYEVVS
jgi:hypothetical protein